MQIIFSEDYKNDMFYLWYNKGKPGYRIFHRLMPIDPTANKKPTLQSIRPWIDQWRIRAEEMDDIVRKELEGRLIQEKIEMLERHANIGQKMQDMSLDYLEKHKEDLNPNTAVRLLVEGVRIERDSKGLPQALEKMLNRTDEELVKDVEKLLANAEMIEEIND